MRERRRYPVLGIWVDATDPVRTSAAAAAWLRERAKAYICLANVHAVMEALPRSDLRAVYNQSALTVPDGMPLVWLGRLRGHRDVRRVYGPDLMLTLCGSAAPHGARVFFYGGAADVASRLAAVLATRFPGLVIAGAEAPPFRPLSQKEDDEAIARINATRPDIVFVGLGCPKQERWMADHRDRLEAPVLVGVGAAFDFHTGRVRQAPRWMMGAGLEWLFRLWQEPRRLWHRYLVYNPLFLFHVTLELLGLRRYPPSSPDGPAAG